MGCSRPPATRIEAAATRWFPKKKGWLGRALIVHVSAGLYFHVWLKSGRGKDGAKNAAARLDETWHWLVSQPINLSSPILRLTSRALVRPQTREKPNRLLTCSMKKGSSSAQVNVTRPQGTRHAHSWRS